MAGEAVSDRHPLESDFGWTLGVVAQTYRRIAGGAVETLPGGPRGYHVLQAVASGQPPSQLALAALLRLDKTVLVHLLDDLEHEGLLIRTPDPADRRARRVSLTPKGRRTLTRAQAQLDAAEDDLTADLSARDAAIFRDLLRRVAVHTQGDAGRPDSVRRGGEDCDPVPAGRS